MNGPLSGLLSEDIKKKLIFIIESRRFTEITRDKEDVGIRKKEGELLRSTKKITDFKNESPKLYEATLQGITSFALQFFNVDYQLIENKKFATIDEAVAFIKSNERDFS